MNFLPKKEDKTAFARFNYPAREVVIILAIIDGCEIEERWKKNGGKIFQGRMIAPLLDPIWKALDRRPPGVAMRNVQRDECLTLGVFTQQELEGMQRPRPRKAASMFKPEAIKEFRDSLKKQIAPDMVDAMHDGEVTQKFLELVKADLDEACKNGEEKLRLAGYDYDAAKYISPTESESQINQEEEFF